ncbi:hypothetical protein IGI04_000684 [Brassica rapa subsp. trilocularis]|uniref:Uncharacterized protein n=1 Tax=Brassica rapa subsp. trilocularis TaxID=1813537 RepID=A0ABQ7NQJ6_BRACM|nr:hypothetical protein IGI04_000684 [Brassica rapa subsp. trilocularis]
MATSSILLSNLKDVCCSSMVSVQVRFWEARNVVRSDYTTASWEAVCSFVDAVNGRDSERLS